MNTNFLNGVVSGGYINPDIITPAVLSGISDVNSLQTPGLEAPVMPPGGNFIIPAFTSGSVRTPAGLPSLGGVSAAAARATLVGKLSVPQGWTTAAQVANPAGVTFAGGGWTSAVPTAPEAVPAAMPGIPGMPTAGGQGFGHGPRYGFRVTVMPRRPAAGTEPAPDPAQAAKYRGCHVGSLDSLTLGCHDGFCKHLAR